VRARPVPPPRLAGRCALGRRPLRLGLAGARSAGAVRAPVLFSSPGSSETRQAARRAPPLVVILGSSLCSSETRQAAHRAPPKLVALLAGATSAAPSPAPRPLLPRWRRARVQSSLARRPQLRAGAPLLVIDRGERPPSSLHLLHLKKKALTDQVLEKKHNCIE
jgi:hypothetical protein